MHMTSKGSPQYCTVYFIEWNKQLKFKFSGIHANLFCRHGANKQCH